MYNIQNQMENKATQHSTTQYNTRAPIVADGMLFSVRFRKTIASLFNVHKIQIERLYCFI